MVKPKDSFDIIQFAVDEQYNAVNPSDSAQHFYELQCTEEIIFINQNPYSIHFSIIAMLTNSWPTDK